MPRPRRELPVRTDAVAPLLEHCARGGIDPARLQRRFRLPDTARTEAEIELPPSTLADAVRRGAAEALIGDPAVPLGEVAFRAGFSDFGTFSRAFRRWTGQSPGAAREATAAARM